MADKKLTEGQAYGRLHKALLELGDEEADTPVANAALKTARRSLVLLQMSIVKAAEEDTVPLAEYLKGRAEP